MAKLVRTICKAKIAFVKGGGGGVCTQATTAQEMSGLVFILASNKDLWTLILDQRIMIHWQSYSADEG